MPANKFALIRYRLIDERIRSKALPHPTLIQLIEFVSEHLGKNVTGSTIEKDILAMRNDEALGYNAPIVYDRKNKNYKYSDEEYSINTIAFKEEELAAIELALQLLNQYKELPAIKEIAKPLEKLSSSIANYKNQRTIIQLDKALNYGGSEWLPVLIQCIKKNESISLGYKKFAEENSSNRIVEPLLLKEHQGRWYLLAYQIKNQNKVIATFAVERITAVTPMGSHFVQSDIDFDDYFKNVIGITSANTKAEKIILEFDAVQAPYIKTQAWHHSQKIIKSTKDKIIVSYFLSASDYELQIKILSCGAHVKVIEPESLKQSILAEINTMKKLY